MLKESKPQSKSLRPSIYQHFKTPSNKYNTQTPGYCSRSNSNQYGKISGESLYKSRSHSRSISHSKHYDKHSSR